MKILVSTHSYNSVNPCGILSIGILGELANLNHEIKVICSSNSTYSGDAHGPETYACSEISWLSSRSVVFISGLVNRDCLHILWERRAKVIGSELCRSWKPDVIYSRSNPIASGMVGAYLSDKFHIPHSAYFSDPIPAPFYMEPDNPMRRARLCQSRKILQNARQCSFGTQQMLDFQSAGCELPELGAKSFVQPNFIPEFRELGDNANSFPVFCYAGSFYGARKADSLILGFERLLNDFPKAELHLLGCRAQGVIELLTSETLRRQIKLLPRVNNVYDAFAKATALIDVDPDAPDNVFSSTKIYEYLGVDRPIIAITTPKSPSAALLGRSPDTIFTTFHGDYEGVYQALKRAWLLKYDHSRFERRNSVFKGYLLDSQALMLSEKLEHLAAK